MRPGAPQLWPEAAGNVALDWAGPVPNDETKLREIEQAFAGAAHVAKVSVVNQRLVVASMEPRGATARYDAAKDHYTLRGCSQGAYPQREQLIAIMGLPREKVRIVTEDVGGAFGLKTPVYPEYPALLVAAKLTGRPVAWMATRSEAFLSDQQARDTVTDAELAIDAKGKFLALRVKHIAAMGAFMGIPGANIQTMNFSRCLPGMYAIPRIDVGVRCVFTNTIPTGPYRGAGRPEANYALERLVDEAARVTGIDPVRLRRMNLIKPKQIPYKTAVGTTYDSGDFAPILDKALALSHYTEFKKRRRESFRAKKLRGIGISCFLEHAGALPTESASLLFPGGDRLVLGIGVQNTGQGHATIYPRLIAAKLGIPVAQIGHRHGDTDLDLKGNPSVGSRSTMTVGSALYRAVDLMLEKAKPIAAGMLEAADSGCGLSRRPLRGRRHRPARGPVRGRGTREGERRHPRHQGDRRHAADIPERLPHRRSRDRSGQRRRADRRLRGGGRCRRRARSHAGRRTARRRARAGHRAGAAGERGLRRERTRSSSPERSWTTRCRAPTDMPPVAEANHNAPATTNPLGVKGVGEAGTTGSIAAIMNAIANAIPDGRGNNIDMPATPEKIWRACRGLD